MNKRTLAIGAGTIVLLMLAVFAMTRGGEKPKADHEENDPNVVEMQEQAQKSIGLKVEVAGKERVVQMVKATGVVGPDETRLAHVFPLAQGVVEKVYARLGDRVQKGQALLQYDNIELGEVVGEHQSVHSQVDREKAQRDVSNRALERADALIQVEAISLRELEVRRAEKQQADAAVESKEAELAKVEEKLHRFGLSETEISRLRSKGSHRTASHSALRAPLAGVVTKFDVAPGEFVTPGKELFTIVDTASLWVLADIYEKDIAAVPSKGECLVTLTSYPDQVFKGKITYLSDFLDPTTRTAKLRCVVPNPDGKLKLQMFADVVARTSKQALVVTVPKAAIQEMDGETVVFVQTSASKFEKRVVKLGERGDERVQILEGVKAGEKVVSSGSFQLKSEAMRGLIGGEE